MRERMCIGAAAYLLVAVVVYLTQPAVTYETAGRTYTECDAIGVGNDFERFQPAGPHPREGWLPGAIRIGVERKWCERTMKRTHLRNMGASLAWPVMLVGA